ncbi:hypothetical protein C0993_002399 [Termitomyces sp. T159_Od127]|nr:hypothetical protein C0993_002399 [Termitomyces sp. T159_Od127]
MLFSPRSVSLAPRIGDDVLPTPVEEWAENTVTSIRHSADLNSLVLPSRTATPGPRVPGAYPFEGEADYSRGVALHHGYIRTQKNVMDAVMGARATAKRYLPGNLASYLPTSTERNSVPPNDTSLTEADSSGAANSIEDPSDHLSSAALDSSVSENNKSEINASSPTSPTNPETEHRPSLLSNISTRSNDGSMLSSPSRYSSQLSLTSPKTEVLHSSSETADTTHHNSEPAATRNSHGGRLSNADTNEGNAEHPDSRNEQEADQNSTSLQDDSVEHCAQSDTPIGTPYPAFLGPIDLGGDKFLERVSGPIGVDFGSPPKSEEDHKVSHTERATEESQVRKQLRLHLRFFDQLSPSVQQPTVHTEARTHPLAGSDAKWNGVPLEEQYQKALDDNSDRQLNLGSPVAKPAFEERKTQEGRGLKVDESRTSNGDRSASRPRTTSVVLDKPVENQRKSHRPASEGYTPAQVASNGHTMSHKRESSKGSRASFLDRLKGEMKVISGKLSNDGAKVEEGRRLMGKIA